MTETITVELERDELEALFEVAAQEADHPYSLALYGVLSRKLRAALDSPQQPSNEAPGDFEGDRNCTTHHNACPCREERFRRYEEALREIARCESRIAGDVVDIARKALGTDGSTDRMCSHCGRDCHKPGCPFYGRPDTQEVQDA